ncbi:MAG: hypothetical protein M3460_03175 [Actinomycetota bacterium]|nr:hypothetical protein [Actinomycetota bacterium]
MSNRSIPIPMPPLGGIPYCIAARKSLVERHRLVITGRRERNWGLETGLWLTQRTGCKDPIFQPDSQRCGPAWSVGSCSPESPSRGQSVQARRHEVLEHLLNQLSG